MKTLKFTDEKLPYSVVVSSKRFAVCTRPIDRKVDKKLLSGLTEDEISTLPIYTLVDFAEGFRSTNNKVFNPYDYSSVTDCEKCLKDLESGEVELSRRNRIELYVEYLS